MLYFISIFLHRLISRQVVNGINWIILLTIYIWQYYKVYSCGYLSAQYTTNCISIFHSLDYLLYSNSRWLPKGSFFPGWVSVSQHTIGFRQQSYILAQENILHFVISLRHFIIQNVPHHLLHFTKPKLIKILFQTF